MQGQQCKCKDENENARTKRKMQGRHKNIKTCLKSICKAVCYLYLLFKAPRPHHSDQSKIK